MLDIFERCHGHVDFLVYDISIATETSIKKADNTNATSSMFQIQSSLTVADLIARFEIKNLVFTISLANVKKLLGVRRSESDNVTITRKTNR